VKGKGCVRRQVKGFFTKKKGRKKGRVKDGPRKKGFNRASPPTPKRRKGTKTHKTARRQTVRPAKSNRKMGSKKIGGEEGCASAGGKEQSV